MFAIYLPGKSGYDPQHLAGVGLGDLLDDVAPSLGEFQPGPDGSRGVYATWGHPIVTVDACDWTRCRGGKFWLGRSVGQAFQPDWLARQSKQLGADVTLADGQPWHFPIARQLPCVLGLDDAGNLKSELIPQYKKFWELAVKCAEWFEADESGVCRVDFKSCFEFVCAALAVNYRVNQDVASWLGIVRSDSCWPVAEVVTDGLWSTAPKKNT